MAGKLTHAVLVYAVLIYAVLVHAVLIHAVPVYLEGVRMAARPGRSLAVPEVRGPEVREDDFRAVLGRFATGVVAVTGLHRAEPAGLTISSFTSVSLAPPLVSFCVAHTSATWPLLRDAERLCVNILAESQAAVCGALAASGGDKFRGLDWSPSPAGQPVLDGAIAWLECSVEAEHRAGDHDIVVARVHRLHAEGGAGPLVFYRGGFGRFVAG
ncbi:flavin reductase family protein [Spirillospora sp. NPDC047279]|uniref:flavin reductase family protein n=1 Tax=Spirillospora sp. NPDC047279 TaxID=3155478 RepID=UPI00340F690A